METERSIWVVPSSLGLLFFSYTFLGWYLAAHHTIWLAVALVVLLSAAIAWQKKPWLRFWQLGWLQILTIVTVMLGAIVLLYLLITPSVLPTLILIPLLSSFLADLEMRFIGWKQHHRLLLSICLAGLGLGLGEIVDLTLLPSARF